MDGVIPDHQLDHILLAVAEAVAQVTAEVEVTADQDLLHQRESGVLRMRTGPQARSSRMVFLPRVGSAAKHLMKAAPVFLPNLESWMTSKRDQIIVEAQGGGAGAEAEALKDRALGMEGMEVQLKRMAAAGVQALGMTGALLMMIMRTTAAPQEAVSRPRRVAQWNWKCSSRTTIHLLDLVFFCSI